MSYEEYRIDSHKMMYHPRRVSEFLEGCDDWEKAREIYPIYLEISPSGTCNHRCSFCALDYIGFKPRFLDVDMMRERLPEMAEVGIKSMMLAGEGEPLLNKYRNELTKLIDETGIDVALTTNGVLFDEEYCERSLIHLTWVKVSLNAGTEKTYAEIHGTQPGDFHRVCKNLKIAIELKRKYSIPCTVGVQILLLPENAKEVETLAKICRDDIGVDYLVIKPYSQHLFSITRRYEKIDYKMFQPLAEKVECFNTPDFKIIFRVKTMNNCASQKGYEICYSSPFFWAYVMSSGEVYSCSAYLGDNRFSLGDLSFMTFKEIWEGKKREQNYRLIRNSLDIMNCRKNCRMEFANRYLWELRHPHSHVNFI
jgi:cyclic pyranopterin phosphate synthase